MTALRADQIVARAEQELRERSKTCCNPYTDVIISTALGEIRRHAEMLEQQATFVRVSRAIFAIVLHALGKLDYPVTRLNELYQFGDDINVLVHSTSDTMP